MRANQRSKAFINDMEISIVIPTYNRINSLKRVLNGLEAQSYPFEKFEVRVISDGSTDGTIEYLEHLDTPLNLYPAQQPNGGAASARNLGLQLAQGEIIIFLDDDVVPAPQLVAEHARLFHEHGMNIIVLGPMLSPADFKYSPWVQWEQDMLVKQYDAMRKNQWAPTGRQFYTGNSSAARRFLLEAGGFDPSFKRAEDVELAYRLAEKGLTFIFNPLAAGYHYAVRSFDSWASTPYAYGKNDVIFHEKKGQTWLIPTMRKEFATRHPFTRSLIWLCLDRPVVSKVTIRLMKQVGIASYRFNRKRLSNLAFSAIFNLRYYQGAADQMGGRKIFFEQMEQQE